MIKLKDIYTKMMNTKNLIILLIAGIALLALPSFSHSEKKSSSMQKNYELDISKYETSMEKKLENILSEINGVGNVSVMITFSDYGKFIYSQEEQQEKSEKAQKGNTKPVLKNSSSGGEEPILIKAELPKIVGVLITAEGVKNPEVKNNITKAVKAVLGINANNISVLEK